MDLNQNQETENGLTESEYIKSTEASADDANFAASSNINNPASAENAEFSENEAVYDENNGSNTDESLTVSPELAETETAAAPPDTMKRYKNDCVRLGLYLTFILLLRVLAQGLSPLAGRFIGTLTQNVDLMYALSLLYSAMFLQIIPSFLGALMLKYSLKNLAGGFHPPKNSKKAFANFPAIYGAGMTVNLITMAVIALVTQNGNINDSINSLGLSPPSLGSSFTLFVMLVVIAPVFEEFVFRGAVMNLLKPYGSGVAVFASALCFGIFHGNFQQFFYAFVLGILLGYISYATNSMFCNTILHAMFNAVSGIIMIFVSTGPVQKKTLNPTAQLSDGEQLVVTFYAIFMIIVLITAFIGFIAMIKKLAKIKKYRLPKVWGEVSNKKKTRVLIFTAPVLLAILLMTDVMGSNYIAKFISGLLPQ